MCAASVAKFLIDANVPGPPTRGKENHCHLLNRRFSEFARARAVKRIFSHELKAVRFKVSIFLVPLPTGVEY